MRESSLEISRGYPDGRNKAFVNLSLFQIFRRNLFETFTKGMHCSLFYGKTDVSTDKPMGLVCVWLKEEASLDLILNLFFLCLNICQPSSGLFSCLSLLFRTLPY